jgi:hypothetical protein
MVVLFQATINVRSYKNQTTDVNAPGSAQHSGFDLFFTSGLTNGLPAMIPVTMLYGTPDDSAAPRARSFPSL